MQALVKMPRMLENGIPVEFTISGNVPVFYMDLTRRLFPMIKENDDDELIEVSESNWYKKMQATVKPGDTLRSLRTMRKMKRKELAEKLGIESRRISDMENGQVLIDKKMAMKLGKALNINYKHFLSSPHG